MVTRRSGMSSPEQDWHKRADARQTLLIACGALAAELNALIGINQWRHLQLRCLPASLHNRPESITDAVKALIVSWRGNDPERPVLVAYGDCGTGGELDRMLRHQGVDRLDGPHCYAMFTGNERFTGLQEEAPGTFYLTDFLVRHFDRLVMRELGLVEQPELRDMLFAHYTRLVFLDQGSDPALLHKARDAAARLGLAFEHHPTGLSGLQEQIQVKLHLPGLTHSDHHGYGATDTH